MLTVNIFQSLASFQYVFLNMAIFEIFFFGGLSRLGRIQILQPDHKNGKTII